MRPVLVTGTPESASAGQHRGAAGARRADRACRRRHASPAPPAARRSRAGAFQIQVGAFQSQTEAERQLATIRERAGGLLVNRAAVTTPLQQGDKTLYRARYAGFEAQATAAGVCSALKRLSINCLVMAAE